MVSHKAAPAEPKGRAGKRGASLHGREFAVNRRLLLPRRRLLISVLMRHSGTFEGLFFFGLVTTVWPYVVSALGGKGQARVKHLLIVTAGLKWSFQQMENKQRRRRETEHNKFSSGAMKHLNCSRCQPRFHHSEAENCSNKMSFLMLLGTMSTKRCHVYSCKGFIYLFKNSSWSLFF